ncbi:MAG: NYN domain-containing protein [Chloroflexota bacterium]
MNTNQHGTENIDRDPKMAENEHRHPKIDAEKENIRTQRLLRLLAQRQTLMPILNQDAPVGVDVSNNQAFDVQSNSGVIPQLTNNALMLSYQMPSVRFDVENPLYTVTSNPNTQGAIGSPISYAPARLVSTKPGSHLPSTLLPDTLSKPGTAGVWLDVENLLISLEKQHGIWPSTQEFVEALDQAKDDLAKKLPHVDRVLKSRGFCDFFHLEEQFGRNLQRNLAELQVDTRYLVSTPGKNSADMKMINDIHEALYREPNLQTVIMGTGDSDFLDIVEIAHSHNKNVGIIAVSNSLSKQLHNRADEVVFLDSYFTQWKSHATASPAKVTPNHKHIDLMMRLALKFYQNNWTYAFMWGLTDIAPVEEWQPLVKDGLLRRDKKSEKRKLEFNTGNKFAQAIEYFVPWIIRRVDGLIQGQVETGQKEYIDTNFLVNGILRDGECKSWGIGKDRRDAAKWLEAAAQAGCIMKESRRHFNKSGKIVDTWWPAKK